MGKQPKDPVSYTNRKSQTYYLHEIVRKSGKHGYAMKTTPEGALTELPEGLVITESVHGTVSVGKPKPRKITVEEEALVADTLKRLGLKNYRCEVKDARITVYEPVRKECELSELVMKLGGFGPMSALSFIEDLTAKSPMDAVMRFTLVDKERRLFSVERMTYRGNCDWWSLERGKPLSKLVKEYLPHLGKESFFELI